MVAAWIPPSIRHLQVTVESMSRADVFARACPSQALLARVGEKWALLVVLALASQPMRFGALRRRLEGVSQKMLTQTLRRLESDGLVTRTAHEERTLRVEYALTALGAELVPIAHALKEWAERSWARPDRLPPAFSDRAQPACDNPGSRERNAPCPSGSARPVA